MIQTVLVFALRLRNCWARISLAVTGNVTVEIPYRGAKSRVPEDLCHMLLMITYITDDEVYGQVG